MSFFVKSKDIKQIKKRFKKVTNPIHELVHREFISRNVIRCWYVEQQRFAEGFDF